MQGLRSQETGVRIQNTGGSCRPVSLSLMWTLLATLGALLTCCGAGSKDGSSKRPVRIALVAPLTGALGDEGQMLRLGVLLAAGETNTESQGAELEVLVYDSPCGGERAITVAKEIAQDHSIAAVIGYLCATSVGEVLPIYREASLPLITPTISAEEVPKELRGRLFSLIFSGSDQAAFLAAYAKKALGLCRVAVIADHSDYGALLTEPFLEEAEKQGLTARVFMQDEPSGAALTIRQVKAANPQALFLATRPETARRLLLERRRQQLGSVALAPDVLGDRDFYEMTGPAADGLLVSQPVLLGRSSPEAAGFVQHFSTAYKRLPDWIAAGGYDAFRLLRTVVGREGPRRAAILRGLEAISGRTSAFRGLGGPIFFGEGGLCRRPVYVARVEQGVLKPAEPPTVDFFGAFHQPPS
jgi:ABC-type branched-subunit amino acid transport system substrate-binding protein